MNFVRYYVIKEKRISENRSETWYGIAAYSVLENGRTVSEITSIHDITNDLLKISDLVDKCNRFGLSTEHLNGIVEDFLAL